MKSKRLGPTARNRKMDAALDKLERAIQDLRDSMARTRLAMNQCLPEGGANQTKSQGGAKPQLASDKPTGPSRAG